MEVALIVGGPLAYSTKKNFGDLVAAAAFILLVATASAQEATFKLSQEVPPVPVGATLDETLMMKIDRLVLKAAVLGTDFSSEMTTLIDAASASRVVGPEKMVSVFKTMSAKTSVKTGDATVEEEESIPLIGKKLEIERVDGVWKCQLMDGEPTAEEQEFLTAIEEEAQVEEAALKKLSGTKDYKVGNTISAPVALFGTFGIADKDYRGKVELKIERIEELDGVRCAVLEGQIGEGGKMEPDAKEGVEQGNVAVNAKVTIWRLIEYALDMKVEAEGTVEMNFLASGIVMKGKGPFKQVTEVKIRK